MSLDSCIDRYVISNYYWETVMSGIIHLLHILWFGTNNLVFHDNNSLVMGSMQRVFILFLHLSFRNSTYQDIVSGWLVSVNYDVSIFFMRIYTHGCVIQIIQFQSYPLYFWKTLGHFSGSYFWSCNILKHIFWNAFSAFFWNFTIINWFTPNEHFEGLTNKSYPGI